MDEIKTNMQRNTPIKNIWIYFAIFVVLFLAGAFVLYRWWLSPWLNSVASQKNTEIKIPGIEETDSDGDGLSLKEESNIGTSDNMTDSDGDRLSDDEELKYKTNPLVKDTDGDGYIDGLEIETGHDPLK